MNDEASPRPEPQQDGVTPAPDPGRLPGRTLREARERQGLAPEEAAERLHLQPAQVRALEDDDYAHFSAPIFIRGHLHNYARLLGLDPEAVVGALEGQGLDPPPILSEVTAAMPSIRRRGMSPRLRAGLVAAGTVLFLSALWLLLRPADIGTTKMEPARAPAQETGRPSVSIAAVSPPVEPAPGGAVPAPEAAPQAAMPDAAGEEVEDEPREEPPPATDEPMDELVLRFSGESWVEVADVTGRRMAYRMGNFPDVLRLRGLAPFDILLGNAPSVSIEYNGEPYENVPISRSNVASFRLGGPSDEGMKRNEGQKSDPAT